MFGNYKGQRFFPKPRVRQAQISAERCCLDTIGGNYARRADAGAPSQKGEGG
jgi:hypothetical protein